MKNGQVAHLHPPAPLGAADMPPGAGAASSSPAALPTMNGSETTLVTLGNEQQGVVAAPVANGIEGIRLPSWFGTNAAGGERKYLARRSVDAAVDLTAVVLGLLIALRGQLPVNAATAVLLLGVSPVAAMWLLMRPRAIWDDGSAIDEVRHVVGSTSVPVLAGLGADAVLSANPDVALGMRIWVFTLALLLIGRLAVRYACASAPAASRPLLIVGAGKVGTDLARCLGQAPQLGLRPVGFLDYEVASVGGPQAMDGGDVALSSRGPNSLPVLGASHTLPDAILRTKAQCVAFAFASETDERLLPLIEQCQRLRVSAFFVPRLFEVARWRMQVRPVGSLPLVELQSVDPRDMRFAIKHAFDRATAAALLFVLAPLLGAIAVAIKLTSRGPVLFRQRRIGRDGREFTMLKFRSMYMHESDAPEFVLPAGRAPGGVEGRDRRTSVGKWLRRASLDELPQLINVLRGDMSLIGPRPERPEYVRRFAAELRRYERRHRVRSGITGLAQTSGLRGQTSIAERAKYDNFYVQNWSFWLDIKIALRTVKTVLSFKGE